MAKPQKGVASSVSRKIRCGWGNTDSGSGMTRRSSSGSIRKKLNDPGNIRCNVARVFMPFRRWYQSLHANRVLFRRSGLIDWSGS